MGAGCSVGGARVVVDDAPSEPVPLERRVLLELEEVLKRELEDYLASNPQIPAATAAVCLPDGTTVSACAGLDDSCGHSRMLIGSVGKTFAAAAVMALADMGALSLSDPARKWLGGEKWLEAVPNALDATVEQLLSHTSGIPDYLENPQLWLISKDHPDAPFDRRGQPLELIVGEKPLFAPGQGFSYSDSNYQLVGMIVEKAFSGKSYFDTVSHLLTKRLGLSSTDPALSRNIPGLTPATSGLGDSIGLPERVAELDRYLFNPSWDFAAGGFVSNAADMAKWASALYGGVGGVFPTAWAAEMSRARPQSTGKVPNDGSYGLGTMVWRSDEFGDCFGHSGGLPGFNTLVAHFTSTRVSVAVQCNNDMACAWTPHDVALRFLRALSPKIPK